MAANDMQTGVDQSVTLTVRATNRPPTISSSPKTQAVKDKPYTYAIHATDSDGQSLHYALGSSTTATGNITVNPTYGFLTWTPGTVGTYRIQINVIDELGLGVAQVFDVEVLATAPNDPPRITSAPSFSAEAGGGGRICLRRQCRRSRGFDTRVSVADSSHPALRHDLQYRNGRVDLDPQFRGCG